MKNYIETLENYITGKTAVSDIRKMHIACTIIGSVHVYIFFAMLILRVWPMVLFNIFSITLYLTLFLLIRKEQYEIAYYSMFAEVVIHSVFAVYNVGFGFGFQFFMFSMIPASYYMFYKKNNIKKTIITGMSFSVLSCITVLVCRYLGMHYTPYYEFDSHIGGVQYYMFLLNTAITFLGVALYIMAFAMENFASQGELKDNISKLYDMVNIDTLTGLYNRRSMTTFLDDMVEKMVPLYIILCDIDGLKEINDTYGHECGDIVIREVGGVIRDNIRGDYACRWGGEEFLIAAAMDADNQVLTMANRVKKSVEDISIQYMGNEIKITLTFGISRHNYNEDIKKTVSDADSKMYSGKRKGKNTIVM